MGDILQLILDKIREAPALSKEVPMVSAYRKILNELEYMVRAELEYRAQAVFEEVSECLESEGDIRGSWWFRFRETLACWIAP